jgi:hypothetical protein
MEIEVFRISPENGKYYKHGLCTRREGHYPNTRYYTLIGNVRNVGKHTSSERWGYGDNSGGAEYFSNGDEINRVVYEYDGTTCFILLPTLWDNASDFIMFYAYLLPADQVLEDETDENVVAIRTNNSKLEVFQNLDLVRVIISFL